MAQHHFSYLALGDSYTIGEGIPIYESFPYQLVQLLRKKGLSVHAPEIVAKTGWTTFELAEHTLHTTFSDKYDFVTLLIGVNNQYRQLPLAEFENDFEFLLKKAIHFAANKTEKVIVVSIPDWGATPFAEGRDILAIKKEIDIFNAAKKAIAAKHNITFIDITEGTRKMCDDLSLVAADGLHPSGKEYARWAEKIAAQFSINN
ncbi:SGNH/GDSL hydrolase family protein [Pinibacter aurantiacus]|uniref:SGNH/GDSL hydrolase family protein n=1 Tax=Pinibacter aurantiacus TaxID=2851599 RepID=A0A9E2S499_9BACT|nr:SGNH/GDSL hydrolase family protein [Pinibacter aurantiacus]MBV4356258.1 SGNH/GDSL hydrolase family protein [Pinibacter aurantiacus]